MTRTNPRNDLAALRLDPAKPIRDLLSPADQKHNALMERLFALYVVTERDERLAAEILLMIENIARKRDPRLLYGTGNRREGTAVAIIADSGAGKTSAMRHYLKDHPMFPGYGDPDGGCQLITVGAKAPCTLRTLGTATLHAAGYRTRRKLQESEAWPQAHFQIMDQCILMIHFEEMQRVIQQKSKDERKKIVETLAGLMTDPVWPLHLIVSGLPALKALFEEHFPNLDAQDTLRRRTRFVEFAPIDFKADRTDIERALKQYEKIAGISLAEARDPQTGARLCHAAARQLGLVFELTVLAIDVCLRAGRKAVSRNDYGDAYAARTLEPYDLNPFAVEHWASIDTSIIQKTPEQENEIKKGKPDRRRAKNDNEA